MQFQRSEIGDLFVAYLAKAKKRYRFQVMNFCVMGNHVHLQIHPDLGESLSEIMRWLLGGFASAFNRKHGLTGHFWGDRFHSRVLDGLRQIAIAFGYIDSNPVRSGIVARACEWRYGGAWHSRMGDRTILDQSPPWSRFIECLRQMPISLALHSR